MLKAIWRVIAVNGKPKYAFSLFCRLCIALMLLGDMPFARAGAGLFIDKTRIVFPSSVKEQTAIVHNENDYPVMVQAWVDDGDIDADLNALKTTLLAVPPLFRLQPNEGKSIKVVNTRLTAEGDRENIFWLNVQMIPPAEPDKPNNIVVSVRTRLKVFYRPDSLIAGGSARWIESITCSFDSGNTPVIRCANPSPYYATVDKIALSYVGRAKPTLIAGSMMSPYDEISYAVAAAGKPNALTLFLINDDGYVEEKTISLKR